MSGPALLAEVWRGDGVEAIVRGHIAAVDGAGRRVAQAGDPAVPTTLRSAVKPLQAVPFVESGAFATLGCDTGELALACASHEAEPVHVATARRLLARAGLDEASLSCGPQPPSSRAAAWDLARSGEPPGRIHNNCSGKHAAMLATCVVMGWPTEGYATRGHPLQRRIVEILGAAAGIDLDRAPSGIDGCGLPTYAIPLVDLARAFGRAARDCAAFGRCQEAMASHPFLVGGTGRFDTALLEVAGDRLTAKIGGAAVWVATARSGDLAVAVKLEAGTGEHIGPIALAALTELGLLAGADQRLAGFAAPVLRNWAGAAVGETRVRVRLEPG